MANTRENYFEYYDPYNNCNVVKGTVAVYGREIYGRLTILSVNDVELPTPQIIHCTPRLYYPLVQYDSEGKYERTLFFTPRKKNIRQIIGYEKLDGTNIFGYVYYDVDGNPFVTYKPRLRPFLTNSVMGPWQDLFNRCKPEGLDEYILSSGYNLSMEMWGGLNCHLIDYPDNDIELSILFGRNRNNDNIVTLSEMSDIPSNFHTPKHHLSHINTISQDKAYQSYVSVQNQIEKSNKLISDGSHFSNIIYQGSEGMVWYVKPEDEDYWQLFKLKPPSIEIIHRTTGLDGKINLSEIKAACWKAYELTDKPEIEDVKSLLSEDYPETMINTSQEKIVECLQNIQEEIIFNGKVREIYHNLSNDINKLNKKEVMPLVMQYFNKKQNRNVFNALKIYFQEVE